MPPQARYPTAITAVSSHSFTLIPSVAVDVATRVVMPDGTTPSFNTWLADEGEAWGIELPSSNFFRSARQPRPADKRSKEQAAEQWEEDEDDEDGRGGKPAKRRKQHTGGRYAAQPQAQELLPWDEAQVPGAMCLGVARMGLD